MSRIAIMVEFGIKPGSWAAFDAHIRAHAQATLREEPGCERFDVLQPLGEDGAPDHSRIMLCEVYRDMAAVEAHRANPRMKLVGEGSKPLLASRTLTLCRLD
ncbi:MAG: antibiotic biosynthesis monooxygenase [Rhodospirillales bacterium]|nr:antibiotic biosynthesis monooxygenase [Rhodospirillales bacterium]MDE2198752.1 antibiotic biosynthesis monooxygenase [Rhodospirillales bacterium]MDE2575670.1 antibiotic biosynthesis monooxygenase [Rhodospirillales bacterium]